MTATGHDQLTKARMANLLAANEARTKRAEDKAKLGQGRLKPATVLRKLPDHWKSAKLLELLMAIPRVGRIKAQKVSETHAISLQLRLEQLTTAQRERIAKTLETRGWS